MTGNKQVFPSGRPKPPAAGRGRVKGSKNKNTAAIKDMILAALSEAGGVDYLVQQSEDNPVAFMGLVAKVLPLQVTGENGGAIQVEQKVREDADVVTGLVAGLAARIREDGVAEPTQH